MYGQQASIDPSLAALLQTAQMVTPDQTPTVAAQVAQAAAQKMMPQGIAQGMPQARQDFQAAMPSMMRNMQQAQMQQMIQQAMQPKPAGIEGLQSNVRMADGGVVGYASRGYVDPQFPEVYENYVESTPGERRTDREEEELFGPLKTARQRAIEEAAEELLGPASKSRLAAAIPSRAEKVSAPAQRPPAPAPAPSPRPPAPRPPAPAQAAPQAGIAQLVAPTTDEAMVSARAALGLPGTGDLRAKENAYLAALKAQPATGQQGLAALQAQQAALQSMHEKAEKESNINSAIQWLLGGKEGPGGSARASMAFSEREDARRRSYYDLQVANAAKRDAIIDLQNAREANNAKAAVEAAQRVQAADLAVAKAEGDLAAHFATSQANVYGTRVRSQDEAANRATQLQIARIQADARNDPQSKEAMAVARVQQAINSSPMLKSLAEKAKFDPTAAAQYAAEEARLYQTLAPELLQNRPAPAPGAALKYNPATGKIE